ncbi:C2 domain-containing protein 2 isoform X2 [Anthonomus grandis grandis]|uniref:C2 domain-containing protein 2 isoform X2 n=1 Tax=Anthonomus grandis grandis TaxID=2921223 RepID=UPI0021662EDB|nr:C2 domain-containing protein 2 isoform X2 [Anthonomus grandis grandis]
MDLAEAVDDLICVLDGSGEATMDTLAMFLFGWILAALFVLWLGKAIYQRFTARGKSTQTTTTTTPAQESPDSLDFGGGAKKQPIIAPKATGAFVPPTPPVRRRLTRQSPAPEAGRKGRYVAAPQCTGPDNVVVLWVNDVFQWLYSDFVIVNEMLQVWLGAVNEYAKRSVAEQGIGVELVRVLPETNPPTITNVFAEADTRDDVTITCDLESTPAFQLKSFRQKGEKVDTSHYRVNVNRFRARLNIFCVSEKLSADVKLDGWPEIKVALAPVGNIKNNLDESQLQEVISEIVTNSLRNAEVHLNLAQYPTCPRLIRHVETPGRMLPLHYDSMQANAYSSTPNHFPKQGTDPQQGDKRLLVKVIRAAQLGGREPFCVVEMDEPPQKNQTSVKKGTDSPFWDEHFLFDLSPHTAELLFEIYDHAVKPHKFLGLGIVGVEELLINPSQRQIITLQSRPYESDPVTGTLTVEFLFIEGADIPNVGGSPYKIKETIRTPSPSRAKFTAATYLNDSMSNGSPHSNLDRTRSLSPNKSTLVIHSVQRQPSQRLVKMELSNGDWKEVERMEIDPNERLIDAEKSNVYVANGSNGESALKPGDISATSTLPSQTSTEYDYRGRPRKRRDFFGTLRRRLGKSNKGRSKSAGPENPDNLNGRDDSLSRSISADRGRAHDDHYRLNAPNQENSRRSSLSEASGLSSASTRTYVNEASTLVLETIENGIKKHYLVPLSLAQKSKWKKKGVKLHIFNDHTFVAKHLQGGTVCQVCAKSIARRFGKQGYECRDCLLKCHKQCHVKVNDNCPTSTIHNIELSMLPVLSE